ncbi:hypothetical protein Q1695_005816 [Nippostrongylus brasiliensis]|nr:hypothetical protein Q1695_005816 [Nippostrongylus brasiliensis]
MPISVEPSDAIVSACGGETTHRISNDTNQRVMFKVKTNNTDDYRVQPAVGFIDASSNINLQVIRKNGAPSNDRLVVQFAPAPSDVTDARAAFRNMNNIPNDQMFTVNLSAQ